MRRTILVLGVIAATAGGVSVVACSSFSSDEVPPVSNEAAALDDGASATDGAVTSDGSASADAGATADARFSVRCRETVCEDAAAPVCCAVSGGTSFCKSDDACGADGRAYHCDDNEDCVALGKGFSICCAVTSNDFDAAFNDVQLSYCSAMPCQGQSAGLAVEACSLNGSADQCHGGSCMPETTFYPFTFSLCR